MALERVEQLAAVESSELEGDLAGDQEPFVGGEGDFVVAAEAAAVVDPAIGALDDPPPRTDAEALNGFRAGHDVDTDSGAPGGIHDGLAGVVR